MSEARIFYRKLLGWRGSIGSRFSLWLGPDHVLLVEANMMTERYQRVWLRDLQGFLVRPHSESRWASGIGAGLMLLFGVLALVAEQDAAVVFWVFFGLCAPVLFYGLFFARTCRFYAVTAVQRTEWPNVARRRQAKKLLARLEPLVRGAQGAETSATPPPPAADFASGSNPFVSAES